MDIPELATGLLSWELKIAQHGATKTGSKYEGVLHEGCWQNQSGHQHHSAKFSPALCIFMQVPIRPPTYSGAGRMAHLKHGALHEGYKSASSINSGAEHHLQWIKVF